jgi:hypothetical protein
METVHVMVMIRYLIMILIGKILFTFMNTFMGINGRGLGASHQTGWTATVSNLVYAVASAREYYKSILSPQGKEFLSIHSKSFNKNYWNPMNLNECFEVKEYLLKSSFKSLMDMMEALFNRSNWKYQNLLVHHAVSVYGISGLNDPISPILF